MPNHYHLCLDETPGISLLKIMQEVNGRYAQSCNRAVQEGGAVASRAV